jgi:hypothetical protein
MEYVFLFFFAWAVVCLPAIIFTAVANSRRRSEAAELNQRIIALTRQLERLERRTHAESAQAQPMPAASATAPAPTMRVSADETRAANIAPPTPAREGAFFEKPATTAAPPPPPVAPPIAAQQPMQPEAAEAGGIPLTPKGPPAAMPPAPTRPDVVNLPAAVPPPPAAQVPDRVAAMLNRADAPGMPSSAQVRSSAGTVDFSQTHRAPAAAAKKSSASLEEKIGANWLPKLGIAIIVIGVGFLIATMWGSFAPWLRVLILYAGAGAMLAGGIFAEKKERYQNIGRALIGGGWAVTVAVTYALRHAQSTAILPSDAADLVLLLGVVAVMVWHTLRYNSQLVTGAAFLLGFAAITLNPDPPYNLVAGAFLIAGMTVIVHRYRWWELEVFGVLASYLNHFYWLYTILGFGPAQPFPHHTVSILLVVAYWAVFRFSYVWRTVSSREEESVSTIAGLLNPLLFLGVMKYQSLHPEWAFYGLLGLGAAEFALGQLPRSRRRVAPFQVLSSLGAALMVAAVPFKYSGDALEILWLAGAEAFLFAGIFLRERLFRGFGLIVSALIVLYTLPYRVAPLAQEIIQGQAHYHPAFSIVLAAVAVVLYANAHVVRRRWPKLFEQALEAQGLKALSFAAGLFAVCAVYACANDNSIGIVLALLVAALALLGRQFSEDILIYQAHWIAAVVFVQTISSGVDLMARWNSIPERILVFVPAAGLLYLSSRHVRLSRTNYNTFFAGLYTWAATALLTILIWLQAPEPWLALAWIGLAVLLATASRLWKVRSLLWQAHVLSVLAVAWTLYASFAPQYRASRVQLLSVGATAALLYLLNWITNIAGVIEDERISHAYSWAGSLLLSWLIWYQFQPVNVSLAWAVLGLLLFELGNWRSWLFLRAQAYVALTCSFAHIFYANFNVLSAPGTFGPEVITVVLLVPIYFWIYWQLHSRKNSAEGKMRVEYLIACLGTATLAALARFELPLDNVVIGYAAIVLAALLAAWFLRLQTFLYQALIMLGVTAFRISMHNFYHLHEAFSSNLSSAVWAIALMSAGVPLCLMLQRRDAGSITAPGWLGALGRRPEQPMFFVPFALLSVLLYLKVAPGILSLAWGAEAVIVFVLALWAGERSFRLAGLGLLLLCTAKIVFWDLWQIGDRTTRSLTLIGVGSLIFVMSYLISRNREALRGYL